MNCRKHFSSNTARCYGAPSLSSYHTPPTSTSTIFPSSHSIPPPTPLPRGQLSQVAELLASQHAQVLQLESSGSAINPERLCSERIAEQQLRIKHARLHQRMLDTQHQRKMLGVARAISVSETNGKGGAHSEDVGGATSLQSPPTARHKQISELSKSHDLQQSKVRV